MRILALVLAVAAAVGCKSKSDNLPVGGGGGGGGGGGTVDAPRTHDAPIDATASAIDAALINGRVCLVSDPRHIGLNPSNDCSTSAAGGFTVRLNGATATTAVDGSFTIVGGAADNASVWGVTGPNIVSSYKVFSDYLIPAISTANYATWKNANSVVILPGNGAIIAQIVRNGAGYNIPAFATPFAEYSTFYDGTSALGTWPQSPASDVQGVAWLAGLNVGTATVTATPPQPAQPQTTTSLPIVDGAITWVTITFL